jgi:hypothetical protein
MMTETTETKQKNETQALPAATTQPARHGAFGFPLHVNRAAALGEIHAAPRRRSPRRARSSSCAS